MRISGIVIDGVKGRVLIGRTEDGASVFLTAGGGTALECVVARDEDRESRYAKARLVAGLIYGTSGGRLLPTATNSMVHDVMNEIDRIAGC